MKKLVFTAAILVQALFVSAQDLTETSLTLKKAKIYRQPAIRSEVVATVNKSDQIKFVRQLNDKWTLIEVNGEVGYIPTRLLSIKKTKKTA